MSERLSLNLLLRFCLGFAVSLSWTRSEIIGISSFESNPSKGKGLLG